MLDTETKQYIGNSVIGTASGYAAAVWCPNVIRRSYYNYFSKHVKKITPQEQQMYWTAAKEAFSQSDLASKKVSVIDINPQNWEPIVDDIIQKRRNLIDKGSWFTKLMAKLGPNDAEMKERMFSYAKGDNACFLPFLRKILVNKEKMADAVFHELGHAINNTSEGFKKLLVKSRNKTAKIPFFVLGLSLITPKDDLNNPAYESKNTLSNLGYKILLYIKKYAGLIIAASMLPLVAEEGLASINAAKLAKKTLSSKLYKKMNKINTKAFFSYALSLVLTSLGAVLANYVKDKITGPIPQSLRSTENNTATNDIKEDSD